MTAITEVGPRGTKAREKPSFLDEDMMATARTSQKSVGRTAENNRLTTRFALGDGCDNERALEALERLAVAQALRGGLSGDDAHFLGVAVREAAVNALRHGRGRRGCSASVLVSVSARGVLVATVRDHGPGFDPGAVPDPLAPANVPKGSGRGLLFMRRFSDRLLFSFPRQGGAVVRLEKDLRS